MSSSPWPGMIPVRQLFPSRPPMDIASVLRGQLTRLPVRAGQRVAVGVGSRGISNLARIVSEVVDHLRRAGAQPFLIPAMGSHGGATPEGQTALLAEYGVSERELGAPVRASMEVRLVGRTEQGAEVFLSVEALDSDGVIVINRVKPHTDFSGGLGSGLIKMMAIGLGKRTGATSLHATASRYGHETTLLHAGRLALGALPMLGGVALVEDQRHQTAMIEVLQPNEIEAREKELLVEARRLMAKLPFDDIDLLLVDRIGKNISGAGLDPNVVGRGVQGYSSAPTEMTGPPVIRRIFVGSLTPETRGNAIGVGMADFTSSRLARAMNAEATFINSLTALSHQCAKMPIHFERDSDTLERALATLALPAGAAPRVMHIQDTLNLETLAVSENFRTELESRRDLEITGPLAELRFDPAGLLVPIGRQ
jgi:hypothetical protein